LTRGDAEKQGIDVGVLGESEAEKLVRYFQQRVDGKNMYQKTAATACNMSPSTFNNKDAQWISQGKPAFLALKSTSRGGRPKLLNEGQLENFKIEVGKRSMEGRGYTLKSGEFAHDLRKYARATLKDAGDQHYNTKQLVMSERVVSA
jgi:transposase